MLDMKIGSLSNLKTTHTFTQTPGPNTRGTQGAHIQTDTHASAGKQAASKQPTSTAVTDTTRPSRPTAAHLGAHGGGGGLIDLEAHEIHQLCHLWHVLGPLMHPVRLSRSQASTGACVLETQDHSNLTQLRGSGEGLSIQLSPSCSSASCYTGTV